MKSTILFVLLCIILCDSCKDNSTGPLISSDISDKLIREAILKYKYPKCSFTGTIYIAYAIKDSLQSYQMIEPDNESIRIFRNICPGFQAFTDSTFRLYRVLCQRLTFFPTEYLTPAKVKVQCNYYCKQEGYGHYYYLHMQPKVWTVDSLKLVFIT